MNDFREDFIKGQLFWLLSGGIFIVFAIVLALLLTPLIFNLPVLLCGVFLWAWIGTKHPPAVPALIVLFILGSMAYIILGIVTIIYGSLIYGALRCLFGAIHLITSIILTKV